MLPLLLLLSTLSSLPPAATASTPKRAPCSGFAQSCGPVYVQDGTAGAEMQVYATYCFDTNSERNYNPAVLINDCLANTFGQLTAGGTGFAYSCRDFGIDPLATPRNQFHATCGDGHGGETMTTIDLNTVLCNINGQLSCSQ